MNNLDKLEQKKNEIRTALAEAIRSGDESAVEKASAALCMHVSEGIIAQVNDSIESADNAIIASRGARPLTAAETKYYNKLIEAMKSNEPKMAITNIDVSYPETIIDSVFTDIATKFPLLAEIDFQNTSILTKIIVNKQGTQSAVWGALNTAIVTELSGELQEIDLTMCKLAAFMYLSQDMLKLGAVWLDRYVRTILTESLGIALETAIVDGSGNNQPIGMTRSVADDVIVTGGTYPRKSATAISDLTPQTYGTLVATLATSPTGRQRAIDNLVLITNPSDYYTKIMPATTMLLPQGGYANNILPYPTKIIQSVGVPSGHAILGLSKRYFMGMGTSQKGMIEYSDEYRFLEDNRTYKIKTHGNGRPLDDNAFIYLDISNLAPLVYSINTTTVE